MDGTGKSTQIKLLAQALTDQGREVISLREPGGTESGEKMREILKHSPEPLSRVTELLLMNASRAQLVDKVIKPALLAGKDILLDRFFYSTIAYQAFGRQLPLQDVHQIINIAIQDCVPTHLFLIKISHDTCLRRRQNRQANLPFKQEVIDRFEAEDIAFFTRVEEGYEYIQKIYKATVIDGTQSIANIHSEVMSTIGKGNA